jgi:photosystem II stability/assembly factor-like uncharacterized protein
MLGGFIPLNELNDSNTHLMSDKKITELPPLTAPTPDDLLAIVNSSVTKKVKVKDLLKSIMDSELELGFFLVPAGTVAPDGEYYYTIATDFPVPILEGEISSGTPTSKCNDAKSKLRVDHAVSLPDLGWNSRNVDAQQINDIFFIDHFNGFAVTESGKIYKTTDCGRTWTQKFSNNGANPIKALASTALLRVIALPRENTRAATLAASTFAVAADTSNIYEPISQPGDTNTRLPQQFIMFATGGTFLYYSSDFGETWTPTDISVAELLTNEKYVSLTVTSAAASPTPAPGTGTTTPHQLFVLGNMGTVVRVAPDGAGGYDATYLSNLPEGSYTGISSASNTATVSGIILYTTGNRVVQGVQTAVVHRSADGITWLEVFAQINTFLYGLSVPSAGVCWVAGGSSTGNGMVFHTEDFGASWITHDLSALGASTLRDIYADPSVQSVCAVGLNSTIVKTTDNGANWNKDGTFITEIGANKNLLAVSAVFDDHAYVAGNAENGGLFYYFLSDTVNGVKYTYTPVDTVWLTVTEGAEIKKGFVTALTI